MVNKRYEKGVALERYAVNLSRAKGLIAYRSAGSHSPIDCTIIDAKNKKIFLIQGKAGKISQKEIQRIIGNNQLLFNEFLVSFHVINKPKDAREIIK